MQQAVRPRPRGQASGQAPAREDAGAPLKRHWLVLILKLHNSSLRGAFSSFQGIARDTNDSFELPRDEDVNYSLNERSFSAEVILYQEQSGKCSLIISTP